MSPERKIKLLKEYSDRYYDTPFSRGDLVTPRACSFSRFAGQPFIVVEDEEDLSDRKLFPDPKSEPFTLDAAFSPNMVVAMAAQDGGVDRFATYLARQCDYEPYVEGAQPVAEEDAVATINSEADQNAYYMQAAVGDTIIYRGEGELADRFMVVKDIDNTDTDELGMRLLCAVDDSEHNVFWTTNKFVRGIAKRFAG